MENKKWYKTVLHFAKPCKGKMIVSVICAVIGVFGGLLPYYGAYQIINLFVNGTQTYEGIMKWGVVIVVGYIVKILFHSISTVLSHISAYTILEGIRLQIAERLMKAPLGTVLNDRLGRLKNVIVDRVEMIELPIAHVIPELFSNLLLPIAVFTYVLSVDWRMALAMLATVPIGSITMSMMMSNYNEKYDAYMAASDHVNSIIVEYVEGIEVIKAFNQSTSSYKKFSDSVTSFFDYTMNWYESVWGLMYFSLAVFPSTLLGTVPVGIALYVNGSLTPGEFALCIMLSLGIVAPLMKFNIFVNDLKGIQHAVTGADDLLSLAELPAEETPVKVDEYSIKFDQVSFSYTENEREYAVKNIDLTFAEGQFTALVGPSGSGKTTLARLAARFWDVNSGSITISNIDIRQIPLVQLSRMITFVTQDNFLFDTTLKENIRIGKPEATDEEVLAAARAARCDQFISKLEKGYETPVGEAGNKLSGGEKQRIAIARAILKNAPIVILDEATAFTDPENEAEIQKSIAALTKGKTLVVIAHRLATIQHADQIILMNEGQIMERNTHEKLLQSSPLYATMWYAHIHSKEWVAGKQMEAANV